jgi:hypothetical protein
MHALQVPTLHPMTATKQDTQPATAKILPISALVEDKSL